MRHRVFPNTTQSARGIKRRELLKQVGAAAAAGSFGASCASDKPDEASTTEGQQPQPPAAGTPQPPTAGAPSQPAAGAPQPPAVGTPQPPAAGTPQPPAAGAPSQQPPQTQPPAAMPPAQSQAPTPVKPTAPATAGADTVRFFPGFTSERIMTSGAAINLVKGGNGPPLLLLHGAPYTHVTWRLIAPELAKSYTVVAADLRGYGDSSKLPDTPDHSNYSKRAMALDQVEVMLYYGFDKFAVVGHDRGARVAQRMALDHKDRVTKIAVIDIVPTYYTYTHVTLEFVQAYFHWFNYLRAAPAPENDLMRQGGLAGAGSDAQREYARTSSTAENIHAMCEDYRAGASIDLQHDAADIDQKIAAPLLTLWANGGAVAKVFDVMSIWQERAVTVTGKALNGGHSLQGDAPQDVLAELMPFLAT